MAGRRIEGGDRDRRNSERWGLQVREKNCNFEAEKKMTERGGRKRGEGEGEEEKEKRGRRRGDKQERVL